MKKILSSIVMLAMLPCAALADISWTNTSSGYWTNAANWASGTYPGQYSTNNASITNGVPSVTLDHTLSYFVPNIILSNGELRVTNTVDTGTSISDVRANGKIAVYSGSLWKCLIPSGATYFSGTNVSVEVRSNATWEASEFRLGRGTVGGDYRVFGGGTLNLQVGGIIMGQTNTTDLLRSAGNFALIDGMTFINAYPQMGDRSIGNTLILSNTVVIPPPQSVSYRAGSVAPCSSNMLILTGPRTVVDTRGAYCYVPNGAFSTGCVWRIENGATLTNSMVVNYAMGVPQVADCQNNSVLISRGGRAFMGSWGIGNTRSHSNLVEVTGSGSMIDITGWWNMTVGTTTTTGNTLRVSDGGDVRGVYLLTVQSNNVLDFTKGRISAHDFNYNPTSLYTLGSNCTFAVASGPTPTYEGVWTFAGGLLVDSNATLSGQGIVRGAGVTITNGATTVGSTEGILTVTNMIWAGGARYIDKISDVGSRAGSGRSCLFVGTNLTFVAPSPNYIVSLDSDGVPLGGFTAADNYVLKFVDAGMLTGYDPTKWTIETNNLVLPVAPIAPFVLTNFGGKLFITYTGAPETNSANGQVWNSYSNGNWSTAACWTNNAVPVSGVTPVLEFPSSTVQPGWAMPITFSGYTAGRAALTNFPALVMLGTNLPGFSYSQFISTNGWDLRLYSGSTELNYEIESWGSVGNSNSYVWVQVPLLENGTMITATWGDYTKTQQPYTTNGAAWASSYLGEWHMKDKSGTSVADSTSSNSVGTTGGSPVWTNGLSDGALAFNGTSDYVTMSNKAALKPVFPFTVSCDVNSQGTTVGGWIVNNTAVTNNGVYSGYSVQITTSGAIVAQFGNNSGKNDPTFRKTFTTATGIMSSNEWHNIAVVFSNATSAAIYLDGVPRTVTASGSAAAMAYATNTEFRLAVYFDTATTNTKYVAASLDNVRLYSGAENLNLVWASWMNMASNSVFQSYGPVGTNELTYRSVNDVAAPFFLNKMLFTSGSFKTNVVDGLPIVFPGASGEIWKSSGGSTIISNTLAYAGDANFFGTEALEGSVTIAKDFNVGGNLVKRGKWTLVTQGSNMIAGNLIVNSRGGGGITMDGTNSACNLFAINGYISNGILARTMTNSYTFGDFPFPLFYRITGPGSMYSAVGPTVVGANMTLELLDEAQVRTTMLTVNASGSPLDINGGKVYTSLDSFIGNSNHNNRVTIMGGGLWDTGASILYVGSGTGTNNVLTLNNGMVDGGPAVYAGGKIGVAGGNYNGILLTNSSTLRLVLGLTTIGPLRIGSGIGSSYNWLDVKRGSRVVSVQGGGSGRTIIGYGSNSTGNWIRVDGGAIDMTQDQNSSGAYIAYNNGTGGNSVGNHLDIINGGFVRFSRSGAQQSCYIYNPASAGANSNYVYIAGASSTYDAEGQPLLVGVFPGNTGNYIRVENGGMIDSADSINVGSTWSTTCTDPVGNYLSVSNGTVYAGVRNGSSYVGGSYRGRGNYIEVVGTNSLLHHPTALYIGGGDEAASSNNVDNYVLVDGATVQHITTLRLGNGTNDHRNYLSLTNGASFQSSGAVAVGYKAGCNSNWISVAGSTWDFGSSALTVGLSTNYGNRLLIGSGAFLDRIETLTVNSNNFLTMNGGYIDARISVMGGTMEGQGAIGESHGPGVADSFQFSSGATLKPTGPFNLADVVLPTAMTVNASNLVGTVLINYSGTASGATDLSGWTVLGAPAGYSARLHTGLKQVYIGPPPKNFRAPGGRALIHNNRIFLN